MSKQDCEKCKNQYNQKNRLPLILPCNHTYCKSCLNKYKNKNLFFCQKCNKNIILSNNNLKPNQKILKKLQTKLPDKSNVKSNNLSINENDEEEEQGEENEEEEVEQDEEDEEGEEEEDDMYDNDEIVEENIENENDITDNNDKNRSINEKPGIRNNEKKKTDISKGQNNKIRKSILKKTSKYLNPTNHKNDNDIKSEKSYNKNKKRVSLNSHNKSKRKSKFINKGSSQDIGSSRVNFTSEESSQNKNSSKESNNDHKIKNEESENEEDENEGDENNDSKSSDKEESNDKSKKLSSRKGTDHIPSKRNSLNKKKEKEKVQKEEENGSLQSIEGNDFCIKHKEKPIEFFCSDCSCAVCSLCIYEVHNGHKLSLLEDISGIIKKKMGELFLKVQDTIKINKDNKFNWQKRRDEVNEFQKQQINIVIKSFKVIINKIEEKKNIIINEFKNKYNHEFNRFDQIKFAIDNDCKEMEKINNLIDNKIKSFNLISDARILKEIEKYKKIFRQTGLDCGKLQKNEIAIKSELSIDPAMKPMTVNINGLIELLNKVDAKNICYPKIVGIIKDENDNNISFNQQKNIGKNDYNLRVSQSNSFLGANNNSNNDNYKIIEEKKYPNEIEYFENNNKIGFNQNQNNMNRYSALNNKYYLENIPLPNLKYKNYSGSNIINNKLSQNELSDYSTFGEYGSPNHNRGKLLRQLDMTPTQNFINIKRSSNFGNPKESQNSVLNNQNIISNNNYMNGKMYNGNYNDNIQPREETAIFKENGFGSKGSEYSNKNNYNKNNFFQRQRNSVNSLNDINNNNDSMISRKNMLVLKERIPSAGLSLKLSESNAIILPKISSVSQANKNSSNKNLNKNNIRNKNNISNSNSEKSNKEVEVSIYFFGEADYCLRFYLKRQEWEIVRYTNQLSKQIGFLRYSGICSLPSYRIIISGGCKKETDGPSNLFLLINSKNINDIKNLKIMPKRKYHHGCIFLNNNIYIIGGYEHIDRNNSIPSTLKTVERYDLSKNQWQNLHGLNEARACFGQCVFNGQIFVFGGLYNDSTLQSIERYNEESNIWSLYHIKLPMKLAKCGIINLDNKNILVLGGSDDNYVPINNVFKCKLDSDSDKNVWSSEPEMICPRTTGNTCFLWKKNIFVFGGSSTNFFEKFDLDNKNWESVQNYFSIIKSSNDDNILNNFICALNYYSVFP